MQRYERVVLVLGAVVALLSSSGCVTTELDGSSRPTVNYSDAMDRCHVENRGDNSGKGPWPTSDSQVDEECLHGYGYDRQWQ